LTENIEIVDRQNSSRTSSPFEIADETARYYDSMTSKQRIHVTVPSMELEVQPSSLHSMSFDAERTEWSNFVIKDPPSDLNILMFSRFKEDPACGYLSVVPDNKILAAVHDQASSELNGLNLVRLYQLRLRGHWYTELEGLRMLLEAMEDEDINEPGRSEILQAKFQRYKLFYVLLVRRSGVHWERIGSGLMLQRAWPSMNDRAKGHARREKIFLI
jgi:hypothetical protein